MTDEQRELFKDLHCYDFSDYCLKDGELAQISDHVYIIYDLDSFYIKYFDNSNNLLSSYRYAPWEHICLIKIKKDLIKKQKWNWFKNIFNRLFTNYVLLFDIEEFFSFFKKKGKK